ncbi:hypothetical protein H6P81_010650 [Aristolochia fimbriata]|uniref:BHLH domain-containing protein n=1 Tax=Aristolochia fimbriata TaxID=158543 RepID=A0AAV7ERG1_ARIFI|nr:hypothetical protein H6P81_010650 [Aristolochia fimbriata]
MSMSARVFWGIEGPTSRAISVRSMAILEVSSRTVAPAPVASAYIKSQTAPLISISEFNDISRWDLDFIGRSIKSGEKSRRSISCRERSASWSWKRWFWSSGRPLESSTRIEKEKSEREKAKVQAKDEFEKNRQAMDSELHRHNQLMRFRSAPSSLLADFVEEGCKDFVPRSSSPETDAMIERFISNSASPDLHEITDKPLANQRSSQFIEAELTQQNGFHQTATHMIYPPPAPLPPHSPGMDNSFRGMNSMAMETTPVKGSGNSSNLIRHSSSPAGLFSNVMDGYGVMRGVPHYRGGSGANANADVPTPPSRLKNQLNFSSRQGSAPGLLSQISELGAENLGPNSEDGNQGSGNNGGRCYMPSFPMSSWDDTSLVSENFTGLKRVREINGKLISDSQGGESGGLSHQFSLPKTSSELAAVEKFLQLHDSVPCKIRAKRGCATHPRSIAERVRRTKISERMRKLQELVPNMDKQTNTADMLDLAVDYIKDLQKQVKMLSENRASCTCSNKPKPYPTPASS